MDKLFDLGVKVVRDYWAAFLVAITLILAGAATPVGMFDFAINSIRYGVVGWAAGWPVIGPMLSQVVAFLAGVWAISFVFSVLGGVFGWVFGFLRKADAAE